MAGESGGYAAPDDLGALRALLDANPGAAILAGGQSLLPSLRGKASPLFVDIGRIAALKTIEIEDNRLRVGAGVTLAALARHPATAGGFAEAIGFVGNVTIRNRATVGGCLAWADPRGELPLVLLALGGTVVTDRREIAMESFITGPSRTALEPGEVIVAAAFETGRKFAVEELLVRNSTGRAVVAAACERVGDAMRYTISGLVDRPVRSGPIAGDPGPWLDDLLLQFPVLADASSPDYRRRVVHALALRARERA
ncbi:MAG: FAD binding domain-containing protein [Sphingosinicella sp.]|nr:FAD binding domain-containing protein [Sphingosinicella sp.]